MQLGLQKTKIFSTSMVLSSLLIKESRDKKLKPTFDQKNKHIVVTPSRQQSRYSLFRCDLQYGDCIHCRGIRSSQPKRCVHCRTLNVISWWGFSSGDLVREEYLFIAITSRSTPIQIFIPVWVQQIGILDAI